MKQKESFEPSFIGLRRNSELHEMRREDRNPRLERTTGKPASGS